MNMSVEPAEPPLGEFEHIEQRLADLVPSLAAIKDLCGTRLTSRENAEAVINDALHGLDIARASLAETRDMADAVNDPGPMPDYSRIQPMLDAGMSPSEINRIVFIEPVLRSAKPDDPHIFGMPTKAYGMHDSFSRQRIAAEHCARFETDWRGVASEWSGWDALWHETWKKVFIRDRALWSADIFGDENRAFYDSLPEQLTIYRGCNTGIRNGHRRLSWTLDKEIARDFSNKGIRGVKAGGHPVIYQGTIAKRNVALALDDRTEKEIVPFTIRSIRDIGVEHV